MALRTEHEQHRGTPVNAGTDGHSPGQMQHEWGARCCWLAVTLALGATAYANYSELGTQQLALYTALLGAVLGVVFYGIHLATQRRPQGTFWLVGVLSGLLLLLMLTWKSDANGIWFLFPVSSITVGIYCSRNTSRVYAVMLGLGVFLIRIMFDSISDSITEALQSICIIVLPYLIEQTRQRESQLMRAIATHTAETDAIANISWSLTTLTPSAQDIEAILQRACPPNVSLALLRYDARTALLTTDAAIGEDAATLRGWSYRVHPESTSMLAQALHERHTLAAATDGPNALRLFAMPPTAKPIRAAAVIPIMRQQSAPIGVLLAISTSSNAIGAVEHLGVLPVVANQMATALENARLFAEAQERADHDAMTGLYHHRALHTRLTEEIERARRSAMPFAILMMDLDRFKLFNETYGHQVGDRIIHYAATIIQQSLRPTDILGRHGGDEFLAILPDTERKEACHLAQTLVEAIAAATFRPQEDAERMPITLSVGLADYPHDGGTVQELLVSVETAMNDAKHGGGNQYVVSDVHDEQVVGGHIIDLRSFGVLDALVTAVDHKDRYTKEHSEEVATFAQMLARQIDLPPARCALLYDAGLLHDVGKVGVPDAVLRKPGRLTESEFDAMKQHVVLSEALLRCLLPSDTDPDVLEAVRHHHERWDGRGYPRGLAGEAVPLIGRIMIVADAVSAMHMDRPYRKGLSPVQIIDELRRGAGTQFDPHLVEPFIVAFVNLLGADEAITNADKAPLAVHPQSVEEADEMAHTIQVQAA